VTEIWDKMNEATLTIQPVVSVSVVLCFISLNLIKQHFVNCSVWF